MINVSVIIPAYNAENWICRCIESVGIENCNNEVECIVVNDGSRDRTLEICKKLSKKMRNLVVESISNGGVSNARNHGISIARGKWILFLDADDELCPNWYHSVSEAVQEDDDFYLFEYFSCFDNKRALRGYSKTENSVRNVIELLLTTSELNTCWAKVYKKEIIDNNHLEFPKKIKIGEDLLFVLSYVEFARSAQFKSEPLICYNDNALSVMHSGDIIKRLDDNNCLLNARLEYDQRICSSSYRKSIYTLHFRALTNILLDMYKYYKFENDKEFIAACSHEYTVNVLQHLDSSTLPTIKKLEYWLIAKHCKTAKVYFMIKSKMKS